MLGLTMLFGCRGDVAPGGVPAPVPAKAPAPSTDPVAGSAESLAAFTTTSVERARRLNDAHANAWGLGQGGKWFYDQETGRMTFTLDGDRTVVTDFQIIGTYSNKSGTFMWGWDHPSVPEHLAVDASRMRAHAEAQGWARYLDRKVECTVEEAWEFTANAARLADSEAIYRAPSDHVYIFMTLSGIPEVPAPATSQPGEPK